MEVGVVGKPNVGKSTFFSAATLAKAEIASYPFTTIDANRGVMYVRATCPHEDFGVQCNPRNSRCEDGVRLVPVEAIDVAGLVPDAHKGKGLGNKFLDDLRQASALIHIVDASGATDSEGNMKITDPINPGQYVDNDDTFQVEKSDINVTYIYGNETSAALAAPTEFGIRVYDLDNLSRIFTGYATPTVKFNVTTNGPASTQITINTSSTNQSGHANVTFLPTTQFYDGNQTWYAYIDTDSSCYKYNNTENLTVTLNINRPPYLEDDRINGVLYGAGVSQGWGEGWSFNVTVMDDA